jgi:TrmH family RNA methyltransferase
MKRLLALSTEKGREKENRFLAEGVHCVEEVLQHHKDIIVEFYHLDSLAEEPIVEKMKASGKPVHPLTSEQMDQVSSTITSQGVFAVCFSEALRPDWDKCKLVTLVDAVQDPGNLGALFRTSVGFGMDAMVLGKGTVNAFNPKVVRGSSGTFLRVPFESRVELAERIQFLRGKGFSIVATSLHTPHTLETMPRLKKKVAILVGNEGAGADSKFVDLADAIIRIPMSGELESLNVAVAHGILSYQLASQK